MTAGRWGLVTSLLTTAVAACGHGGCRACAYEAATRATLRGVAAAQETYHADHGVYASSLAALPAVQVTERISVVITGADERQWRAAAIHQVIDRICVIRIDSTTTRPTSSEVVIPCGDLP